MAKKQTTAPKVETTETTAPKEMHVYKTPQGFATVEKKTNKKNWLHVGSSADPAEIAAFTGGKYHG